MPSKDSLITRFRKLEEARRTTDKKAYVWMLFGWFGNKFYYNPPPDKTTAQGKRYLNLGCGPNRIEGWVNADFYRFHEWFRSTSNLDWMLDFYRELNCPDNYWDGVFVEHANEHLSYSANTNLLAEIHRVLKPGAIIRLVVPDLNRYLNFKDLQNDFEKFKRYHSLPEAVSNLTQNHGHASVWTAELMTEVLESVGFSKITVCDFQTGGNEDLLQDNERRRWESMYVEAQK